MNTLAVLGLVLTIDALASIIIFRKQPLAYHVVRVIRGLIGLALILA